MSGPPWSTHRIAPLRDGQAFHISKQALGRTLDGRIWTRWATLGDYGGWYAIGTRQLELPSSPPATAEQHFWSSVYALAAEVGNGNVDAVHCLGPGVLSVGGLALTAASGYAQALLVRCLQEHPLVWLSAMGPAIADTGVWVGAGPEALIDGCALLLDGTPVVSVEELDGALRLGAGTQQRWTLAGKRRSRHWVSCVAEMLSDECMDRAQVGFCRDYVPEMIPAPVRERIAWPESGCREGWWFTLEQRALWVVAMVLIIEDLQQATQILERNVQTQPRDAAQSLRALAADAAESPLYQPMFRRRVQHTLRRAREVFGLRPGAGE
jgi:hypothetical protein